MVRVGALFTRTRSRPPSTSLFWGDPQQTARRLFDAGCVLLLRDGSARKHIFGLEAPSTVTARVRRLCAEWSRAGLAPRERRTRRRCCVVAATTCVGLVPNREALDYHCRRDLPQSGNLKLLDRVFRCPLMFPALQFFWRHVFCICPKILEGKALSSAAGLAVSVEQ